MEYYRQLSSKFRIGVVVVEPGVLPSPYRMGIVHWCLFCWIGGPVLAKQSQLSGRQLSLVATGAAIAYYFLLRPQILTWNTHPSEPQRFLPGDDVIKHPTLQLTQAIDIEAPPEAVWPWLSQMGRDRTGYYCCDWLLNRGIPSISFIRHDFSPPEAGLPMDGGFHVIQVEPNHALLFGAFSAVRWMATVDSTSLYLLDPRELGTTRLIVRQREYAFGPLSPLYMHMMEPLYALTLHQQLLRLKALSERSARASVLTLSTG